MTPIDFNNLDFEEKSEDKMFDLYYQGRPFTGFLKEDNCIIEYKDGFANGRFLEYYPDSSVRIDGYCKNGEYIGGKEWYQNGQLQIDGDKVYKKNGVLAKTGKTWLYDSGRVKEEGLENSSRFFSPNGELAFEISYMHKGDYKNIITFQNDVMIKHYSEIITDIYFDLEINVNNIEYYFYGWLATLFLMNDERAKLILKVLTTHKQTSVSNGFLYFEQNYLKWELINYIDKLGYHVVIK